MVDTRIYYLAPLRKTIFSIFTPISLVWKLKFALSKQFEATPYIRSKPSFSHEFLWSVDVGMSKLLVWIEKRMRKIF